MQNKYEPTPNFMPTGEKPVPIRYVYIYESMLTGERPRVISEGTCGYIYDK